MLQIGSMIFKGTYEDLLGSELLLTETPGGSIVFLQSANETHSFPYYGYHRPGRAKKA